MSNKQKTSPDFDQKKISTALKEAKKDWPVIAVATGLTQQTFYNIVNNPEKKVHRSTANALNNYFLSIKKSKGGK